MEIKFTKSLPWNEKCQGCFFRLAFSTWASCNLSPTFCSTNPSFCNSARFSHCFLNENYKMDLQSLGKAPFVLQSALGLQTYYFGRQRHRIRPKCLEKYCHRKVETRNCVCQSRGTGASYSSIKSQASEPLLEKIHLLPSTEASFDFEHSFENFRISTLLDESKTLYRIVLGTSYEVGSELTDTNAKILLCMIGENGNSLLHRVASIEPSAEMLKENENATRKAYDQIRFQRGSIDTVTLCGPDIGRLAVLWIGPDSGSWRLSDVNVTAIHARGSDNDEVYQDKSTDSISGFLYKFSFDDILLGYGGDSAAELRPSNVQEIFGKDIWLKALDSRTLAKVMPGEDAYTLRQASLNEYKNLKLSMLFYDAVIVSIVSFISAMSGIEETSKGFAIGGILGFVYLLLLQRTVDKLPSPPSVRNLTVNQTSDASSSSSGAASGEVELSSNNLRDGLSGFRGPLTGFAWAIALIVLVSRFGPQNFMISLRPQELLAGAAGFVTCKVATVIAAFKPLNESWEDFNS